MLKSNSPKEYEGTPRPTGKWKEPFLKSINSIEANNIPEVQEALEKFGREDANLNHFDTRKVADIDGYEVSRYIGLMHVVASAHGDGTEVLQLLYDYGVNPYQISYTIRHKWTVVDMPAPVVCAAKFGKLNRLKWFQEKGVKLYAKFNDTGTGKVNLLDIAAKYGYKDVFTFLFNEGGAGSYIREGIRKYPLKKAIDHSLDMVKFMVDFAREKNIDLESYAPETLEESLWIVRNEEIEKSPEKFSMIEYLVDQFKASSEALIKYYGEIGFHKKETLDALKACHLKFHPDADFDAKELKTLGEDGTTIDQIG
ncbi:hypothetical protein phytr_2220 [Candidatus Phycorickettsia trachydisci]|uniref:Ankyrin repeat protein n=1 Tax=Candidatus Phycorickettsia trachydisci TaxID=2115978 RepID=A0A2P1P7D8_9RICK|nr:hypothetical protein [Candidatus Phycorickettsia trachydisci]AVP87180.1 hypothetical protein phytr_2220 [Candidatus Phycorickettsia trachydisci]